MIDNQTAMKFENRGPIIVLSAVVIKSDRNTGLDVGDKSSGMNLRSVSH